MADRIPLIAGNWKMYKTSGEGARFIRALAERLAEQPCKEPVQVVVAPAFSGLYEAVLASQGSPIEVAAQNVYWETEGAFTGEVSPPMLKELSVRWVIVGHSERRQLFGETDEAVARKVRALLDHGLKPILCVGETEQERLDGLTEQRLREQLAAGLSLVKEEEASGLAIAYEPVWAIGTGRTATPEIAQQAMSYARGRTAESLGGPAADGMRILYGGSVKPNNIAELMRQPDIDGALVGGASLELESFFSIIHFAG